MQRSRDAWASLCLMVAGEHVLRRVRRHTESLMSSSTASSPIVLPLHPVVTRAPIWLVLVALACGGFAIGTTEFVAMGLLPQLAAGVGVSISEAGHAISAYALGVVVGAPVMAFVGARWPRRAVLVGLMALFVLGNGLTAIVDSYPALLGARFIAGLPHGAYFGVASLVAASVVPPHRAGRAVAGVMLGLSFANLVGVPAATWLGQNFGWRAAFWVVAALGVATIVAVIAVVPKVAGDDTASWRTELAALGRPQVILALLAGAIGFGGLFVVYTYVVPLITEVGGLPESTAPLFLFAFGLGMVFGTWIAGRLVDWSVFRSLIAAASAQALLLAGVWLLAPTGWALLPLFFGMTTASSVFVLALQIRLMRVSGDAQTIGAAMNHAALNVANALGAFLGGLVIAAGWGVHSTPPVGVVLSVLGLIVVLVSLSLQRRSRQRSSCTANAR